MSSEGTSVLRQLSGVQVVRRSEAEPIMEGDEFALKYFHSERLVFSYSTLPPGGKSILDPGHQGADEVVYVTKGQIVVEIGTEGDFVNLVKGDAALIEDSVPHTVYNPGPGQAEMAWSTAPRLGRPDRVVG